MIDGQILYELHFELLLHPPCSPDLASSDYYLFANLPKRDMIPIKRQLLKLKMYFEGLGKSFYKKGIEILEQHWNDCITLEGDYVDE